MSGLLVAILFTSDKFEISGVGCKTLRGDDMQLTTDEAV